VLASGGAKQAVAMSAAARVKALDPAVHCVHALHAHDRDFRESNCYVDLWIELLHAVGLEPTACLAFTLASDFEGDQWTFFKPPHADLHELYGVRVEELTPWRTLVEHVGTQLERGRLPLIEVDAYYLPDTTASDYRRAHVKTSIAIAHLNRGARRLHYFHNAGFFALEGDDFDGVFRLGAPAREDALPLYCEMIKLDRVKRLADAELRALARGQARRHLALRPAHNPLRAHAATLQHDVELIAREGLGTYHGYSFAVMRQLGANYELAAAFLRWLGGDASVAEAAGGFSRIAKVAKMLILKLARIANSGRPGDLTASFEDMARDWDSAMARLAEGLQKE
jgi:hypothetical protein